jgi:hypothetical protein
MPAKLGELTALDMESGEAVMRNNEGALLRGHLDVRAGGMVVFVPGAGSWEPEASDVHDRAVPRSNTARARDAGRPPGTTEPAGDNANPADRRKADAARRRREREEARENEEAAREAEREADAERARAAEATSLAAIEAAAGAGDGDGQGDGTGSDSGSGDPAASVEPPAEPKGRGGRSRAGAAAA